MLLSESVELTSFSLDLDACLVNLFSREILSHGLLRAIFSAGLWLSRHAFRLHERFAPALDGRRRHVKPLFNSLNCLLALRTLRCCTSIAESFSHAESVSLELQTHFYFYAFLSPSPAAPLWKPTHRTLPGSRYVLLVVCCFLLFLKASIALHL